MGFFVINGELWRVIRVGAGDPRLVDRTGEPRLATTNPRARTICVLDSLQPPMLDRVVLHEVAHAVTVSHGLLPSLWDAVESGAGVLAEEWAAQLVEKHALEAVLAASKALGRPVCIGGVCFD